MLGKTYQELTTGIPGLGDVDGVSEEIYWMAFDRIEPWGDPWAHTATVAHTVACGFPRKQGSTLPKWKDFYPSRRHANQMDADEMVRVMKAAFPPKN